MTSLAERLFELENRVSDLTSDLRTLRSLVESDHAAALNKMRFVTERILHQLCTEHDVKWGKSEPTLESMIEPLLAKKVIPKDVAVANTGRVNIVIADDVQGLVTLELADVPWDQVLDLVVKQKGLRLRKDAGVYYVSKGDQ